VTNSIIATTILKPVLSKGLTHQSTMVEPMTNVPYSSMWGWTGRPVEIRCCSWRWLWHLRRTDLRSQDFVNRKPGPKVRNKSQLLERSRAIDDVGAMEFKQNWSSPYTTRH